MTSVCKQQDEHVQHLRWVVTLSNGEEVLQDDDRPGVEPASAWLRLRQYMDENSLDIVKFRVEFRSHIEYLPSDQDGYFFCKAAVSPFFSEETHQHFVLGILKDGMVEGNYWKTPELIPTREISRSIQESGPCLIINPSCRGRYVSETEPAPARTEGVGQA